MYNLVALCVPMLGVFLAWPEYRLKHADFLRSVRFTGDQFPAFKRRDAVFYAHEFVLDYAFTDADFVFLDCHGPTA
jgi:hypothetical protein